MYRAVVAWYYVAPGVAVFLAGQFLISSARIWFARMGVRVGRRSRLPRWPLSPSADGPAIVGGEVHHQVRAIESPAPCGRPSHCVAPDAIIRVTGVKIDRRGGSRSSSATLNAPMTPHEFIAKWRASELKERSASQEHFIDLCRLLGEPTPAEADPTGEAYCFERGARKDTGGDGWADVWKRHHFAWEYKGKRADLDAAFGQLRLYALALENPPLLIVSDMLRFRIRTNWTNSVSKTYEFGLDDLAAAATRDRLKWAFSDPERLRPGETRQSLTERATASFAKLAHALRERGHDPHAVAHFVNRLVFCMFAADVDLLPGQMFTRMLEQARRTPAYFADLAGDLFRVMPSGGRVGFETVDWFNGGLFDDAAALPLEKSDIDTVLWAIVGNRCDNRCVRCVRRRPGR